MSERYYKCGGCKGVLVVTGPAIPETCGRCGAPFVECEIGPAVDLDSGVESVGYLPLGPKSPS